MRIEDLEFLVEVAETKSITLAAEKMNISQQGLSQIIRKIEENLDVPLFIRFRHGVSLTAAGEKAISKAKELLAGYNGLLQEMQAYRLEQKTPLTGDLTISCTFHFANTILLKALETFNEKHPYVNLIIHENLPREIVAGIEAGDTVLGLINMPEFCDPSKYINNKVIFKQFFREKQIVCVSKSSPLAKKANVTLAELQKYPFAFYDYEMFMEIVTFLFRDIGKPAMFLKTHNPELYRKTIIDGMAVGIMSLHGLNQNKSFKEKIVTIPIYVNMIYGWVCSAERPMPPTALEFVKCLEASLSDN